MNIAFCFVGYTEKSCKVSYYRQFSKNYTINNSFYWPKPSIPKGFPPSAQQSKEPHAPFLNALEVFRVIVLTVSKIRLNWLQGRVTSFFLDVHLIKISFHLPDLVAVRTILNVFKHDIQASYLLCVIVKQLFADTYFEN